MTKYRAVPDGNGYAALITSEHASGRTVERIGEYSTPEQAKQALEARTGKVEWTQNGSMLEYDDSAVVPYKADLSAVGQRTPNGAKALDYTNAILDHYARWGDDRERHLIAAWIAHTWLDGPGRGPNGGNGILSFNTTPRVILLGYKGSGKSRKQTLVRSMCRNPTGRVSGVVTAYGVWKALSQGKTVILDEAQRYFYAGRAKEDLQGIIAGGYTFDGVSLNGRKEEGEQSIFGPIMLAAQPSIIEQTGDQLDDLWERSFPVWCEKNTDEIPDLDDAFDQRAAIARRELALWAADIRSDEKLWHIHSIPKVLTARDREITIPLCATADRATDPAVERDIRWAVLIREAAVHLLTGGSKQDGELDLELIS
jgi:hypothetical protein